MKKLERLLLASLGMTLICVGVAIMAQTSLGSDCLTLLMQALQNTFGFTLGTWNTILGIIFLAIALICDRKKIGYSTFFYVLLGQYIIDGCMLFIPYVNNIFLCLLYALLTIIIISFGSALGISARLGMSFYDAFCFSVSEKFHIKYVYFRYAVEASFLIISICLKTYPGIGAIIYFVTFGPTVSFLLKRIKEPIRKHLGLKFEN